MAVKCVNPDPIRRDFGYGKRFYNSIKRWWKDRPSKSDLRNTIRNLGVDDERMLNLEYKTKGGKTKKLLGKNLTDVSDWNARKGSVPSDVIVKVPSKTGSPQYFISGTDEASLSPSRWIKDENNNEIYPNPDWDSVGVNKTIDQDGELPLYVRDEGRYRLPEEGEEGEVFLNIKNPIRTDGHVSHKRILDEGIDAIQREDGSYELIHEPSQAIDPNKITTKPNRAATVKEQFKQAPNERQLAEVLKDWEIPTRMSFAVAGGLAGDMADPDGDNAGTFWGGALGLALGAKRARNKVKGLYNRTTGRGSDEYDERARSIWNKETEQQRNERLRNAGYRGALDDEAEKTAFEENVMQPKAQAQSRGEGWFNGAFETDYFQSGIDLLTKLGSQTADRLLNVFRGFESAPTEMYSRLGRLQTMRLQDYADQQGMTVKEAFDDIQIKKINELNPNREFTEEQALSSFGAAADRIIKYGAKIEDGKFQFDDSVSAKQVYQDDTLREIDRAILEDQQAMEVVNVTREFYSNIAADTIQTLGRKMDEYYRRLPKYQSLIDTIQSTDMFPKEFEKAYAGNKELLERFKAAKQDQEFKQWLAYYNDYKRFDEMKDRYVPQYWKKSKEAQEKQKWLEENGDRFDTSAQADEAWDEKVASDILRINKDKWKKYSIAERGVDTIVDYYDNYKSAQNALRNTLEEVRDPQARQLLENDLQRGNVDRYIRTVTDNRGREKYYLETPDQLKEQNINLFQEHNINKLVESNRAFKVTNLLKHSNFFDRPRNMNLPTAYRETNLEKLAKLYSDDFSIRLHAIKNDMYDKTQLNTRWLKNISDEVLGAGLREEEKLNKDLDRVKSWFANLQGMRSERKVAIDPQDVQRQAREYQKQARNELFLNGLTKLSVSPFLYGVTFYSPFTPLVMGSFMGSWKSVLGSYKHFFHNPQDLKNVTRELEKMGNINKTFESYYPEYRKQRRADLLGDNHTLLKKFSEFADNVTEFSANFSIPKKLGIDLEDSGLLRLGVGSLIDISGAEAGLTTYAVMRHVEDLVEAGDQILKNMEGPDSYPTVRVGGTEYNYQRISSELEELGISDVDSFIRNKKQFNDFVDYLKGDGSVDDFSEQFYGQMTRLTNQIIDQYHGRTKLSRPLKWVDNVYGRMLSKFSVYSQNFGVQTTRRRIYRPIADWNAKYESQQADNTPLMKIAYHAMRRNDEKFKEMFGDNWKQAYNEFPVQAVNNFFKVFGALGAGYAMYTTRGAAMDVLNIATNEALGNDDYEAWQSLNKQLTLGTDPETGEEFTFGDVFSDGVTAYEMTKMFTNGLHMATQLGFGGRYAQVFANDMRYAEGGPLAAFPLGGQIQEIWEKSSKIFHQTPYTDLPETAARELLDFTLFMTPNAGTFYGPRQAIVNGVLGKPKNRTDRSVIDQSTGQEIDLQFMDY